MTTTGFRRVAPLVMLAGFAASASAQDQRGATTNVSPHEVRTTKFTIGDVDTTTAFYEDLVGMRELDRFIAGDSLVEPFMGFGEGTGRIGLLAFSTMETVEKSPHPVSVVFTPDLDAIAARFTQAEYPLQVFDLANGARIGIATDPSGNTIELVEREGPPEVGGARLIVGNLAEAEEFFVRLFDATPGRRIETDAFDEVFMELGPGMFVALFEPKGEAPLPKSEQPVVAIYSSAFDTVLERVKAGGLGVREYGTGMFLATGPFGNVVEVVRRPAE